MYDASWLLYASAAVWLGLGAYLFILTRKAADLETRLRRLEASGGLPKADIKVDA